MAVQRVQEVHQGSVLLMVVVEGAEEMAAIKELKVELLSARLMVVVVDVSS